MKEVKLIYWSILLNSNIQNITLIYNKITEKLLLMRYFTFSLSLLVTKSKKSGTYFILTTYLNLNAKFWLEILALYVDFVKCTVENIDW